MDNKKLNEYHVWIAPKLDGMTWEEYKKIVTPKIQKGLDDFFNMPLTMIEYSKQGGFLTAQDEKYYQKLFNSRRQINGELRSAFSLEKISEESFAIVCDFSKLLPTVANRHQMEGKYLFDYTDDELKLNEMYEVVDEVFKKFQRLCAFPEDNDFQNPQFKKINTIAMQSEFISVADLSQIPEQVFENVTESSLAVQPERTQKVRKMI